MYIMHANTVFLSLSFMSEHINRLLVLPLSVMIPVSIVTLALGHKADWISF